MHPHLLCLEYTLAMLCAYSWSAILPETWHCVWSRCAFISKRYEALVFLFAVFRGTSRPEHGGSLGPTLGFFSADARGFSRLTLVFSRVANHLCHKRPGPCPSRTWCSELRLLCQLSTPRWSSTYPLLRLRGFCTPFSWPLPDFLPVPPTRLCCSQFCRFNVKTCVLWCTVLGFPCTYRCRAIISVPVQCYSASVV